jgi:tetratricopeptide (TPR) repeat protein
MSKNRRRWRYLLALLLAAGLLWVASALRQRRRDRNAFAEIEAEMNNGRFGIAARNLSELLPRRPVLDQAAYLLGTCEKARGRYQAATEAWARVTPGSEFSYQAVQARARLAEDNGRFADAERLVNEAVQDPRSERTELLVMLVPLFRKAAIDGVPARHEKLYDRRQPIRHAVEMASLAERLGRTFEARAFLTLAIAEDPEREGKRRDLARLLHSPPAIAGRAQTLAEALAHALGDVKSKDAKDWRVLSRRRESSGRRA